MKSLKIVFSLVLIALITVNFINIKKKEPTGIIFHTKTLERIGIDGDNWCTTWANDGSQITSMCDGAWLGDHYYHNHLYRIKGDAGSFDISHVFGYPEYFGGNDYPGWFGYGVVAIDNTIYSMVSKTPGINWSGPFRGVKMLKSSDNGETWYRVNKNGKLRFIEPSDSARNLLTPDEMFFMEEFGKKQHGQMAYPFSWVSFVQNGKAGSASRDGYIYIYAPESSNANELLLARARNEEFERRSNWEYFRNWDGTTPVWTNDIEQRGVVHVFPEKNSNNEYFGWYSWLPSVVWNEGIGLYIMVNGGTYGGRGMTNSQKDYYDGWMHTKTGSLGFWYSENPYGPWEQFYYTDYWIVDNEKNRTYQPKLSPKWISEDGLKMTLVWSDAMENKQGQSHTINYKWNQMQITLKLK
jgi:hypothetical protein